jgi:hypothetical protein
MPWESSFYTKNWSAHCTELKTIQIFEIGWLGHKYCAQEVHYIYCSKQGRNRTYYDSSEIPCPQSSLFQSI